LIEEWLDIKGFERYYQVSNKGRVRSLDRVLLKNNGHTERRRGQIMSQMIDKDGYLTVGLRKDNKKTTYGVHRLVAKAFIPNSDNLPEVNHKDEVKSNNKVDNLEWCTTLYNINYGTAIDRRTLFNKNRPMLVYQDGCFIKEYENIISLCNEMNIDLSIFNARDFYFKFDNYIFAYKDNHDDIPIHIDQIRISSKMTKYMVTYDLKGNIIKEYMNIDALIIELKTTVHAIRKIMDSDKIYNNMFIRSYKNYQDIKNNIDVLKLTRSIIVQYDSNMNKIKEWSNANEIKTVLGYDNSQICKCTRGEIKQSYGFIWNREIKELN